LLKDTPPAEIVKAIELVAGGDGILSPAVARQLIEHIAAEGAGTGTLTEREREVARAIGQGKSNADIAAELYMSVATVKAHVTRVLSKLDVENRVQIALLVQDARL
jgi:DNA-binding NarL/FixJ family response regulator